MEDNGYELDRVYDLVFETLNELMSDIGSRGTVRHLAYSLLADMKPVLEAIRKAASDRLVRGADLGAFYALVLDHMRELPGKLREL